MCFINSEHTDAFLVFACASFSFKRKRLLIVKKNILLIVACARDEDNVSDLFHPC